MPLERDVLEEWTRRITCVDVLVDVSQACVELTSAKDREGFYRGFEDDNDDKNDEMELEDSKLPPHERCVAFIVRNLSSGAVSSMKGAH
jgi:hypothetical protein